MHYFSAYFNGLLFDGHVLKLHGYHLLGLGDIDYILFLDRHVIDHVLNLIIVGVELLARYLNRSLMVLQSCSVVRNILNTPSRGWSRGRGDYHSLNSRLRVLYQVCLKTRCLHLMRDNWLDAYLLRPAHYRLMGRRRIEIYSVFLNDSVNISLIFIRELSAAECCCICISILEGE